MQVLRTPLGTSEIKQINQVIDNQPQESVKRIELDSYSNDEMELYLYFQNLGKYPTENPLK